MGWHFGKEPGTLKNRNLPLGTSAHFWYEAHYEEWTHAQTIVEYGQYLQGKLLGKISLYRS